MSRGLFNVYQTKDVILHEKLLTWFSYQPDSLCQDMSDYHNVSGTNFPLLCGEPNGQINFDHYNASVR